MCDTLWKRLNGEIIFAKNSDRACNEPNLTVFIEGGKREEKEVKCTYISIPEVKEVYSVLLVKPNWMWGAEMGINEHGVTIGNEAVFTKSKGKKEEKLLGMDMLRLALERADTASKAKDIILELLKTYGQGGNCGFDKGFYYDNSFLITDKDEGFIIETAGKEYVLKKLDTYGNISNRLSIDDSFTKANTEPVFTFFSGSRKRLASGCENIKNANSLLEVFNALRAHDCQDDDILFKKGSLKSVCMHQSLLGDHTTGSMVVHYGKQISIWITGASTPCLSIFKPVVFGALIPPVFALASDSLDYWKKREYLNRAIFSKHIDAALFREKARHIEKEFVTKYENAVTKGSSLDTLKSISKECSDAEEALISEYQDIIDKVKVGQLQLTGQWFNRTKNL